MVTKFQRMVSRWKTNLRKGSIVTVEDVYPRPKKGDMPYRVFIEHPLGKLHFERMFKTKGEAENYIGTLKKLRRGLLKKVS